MVTTNRYMHGSVASLNPRSTHRKVLVLRHNLVDVAQLRGRYATDHQKEYYTVVRRARFRLNEAAGKVQMMCIGRREKEDLSCENNCTATPYTTDLDIRILWI